jgi:Ser/Thr protein kinase RdoA (MazF antagonist)
LSFPSLPARYSLLSASALGTLAQTLWQVDEPLHCQLLQPAQSGGNDLYLVTSKTQRFVLRAYLHGSQSWETLEAGAQLTNALAQQQVSVNRPLSLIHGTFTTSIQAPEGLRHLQLFAFVSGTVPGWQMTEEQAMQYGRTVAHLHEAADRLSSFSALPTLNEDILLHAPVQVLSSFLDENASQTQELKKLTMLLQKHIACLPRTLPDYGFCHADCHKMNVLCTKDGQLTLIDFDCAGYSWRAYELSVFLWSLRPRTEIRPKIRTHYGSSRG